jgi:hypothetical protein
MKKITLIGSILLNLGLIGALLYVSSNKTGEPRTGEVVLAENQTPLEIARMNIKHYVDSSYKFFNDSLGYQKIDTVNSIIRSYSVNKNDLLSVLGLSPYTVCKYYGCRVYLGLDPNHKFKLYLTPLDSEGEDIILMNPCGKKYLLDLNAPCPSTCGKDTLLNPKVQLTRKLKPVVKR